MQNFETIVQRAHEAGMAAVETLVVRPMTVVQHENPLDNSSPVVYRETVPSGPCGFAWIAFKGNTTFGRWAKKTGLARKAYPSGLSIWVSDFGQSLQRKDAYASAYAKVLRDAGIEAHAGSRYD